MKRTYYCKYCNFQISNKNLFKRHLSSRTHLNNIKNAIESKLVCSKMNNNILNDYIILDIKEVKPLLEVSDQLTIKNNLFNLIDKFEFNISKDIQNEYDKLNIHKNDVSQTVESKQSIKHKPNIKLSISKKNDNDLNIKTDIIKSLTKIIDNNNIYNEK